MPIQSNLKKKKRLRAFPRGGIPKYHLAHPEWQRGRIWCRHDSQKQQPIHRIRFQLFLEQHSVQTGRGCALIVGHRYRLLRGWLLESQRGGQGGRPLRMWWALPMSLNQFYEHRIGGLWLDKRGLYWIMTWKFEINPMTQANDRWAME